MNGPKNKDDWRIAYGMYGVVGVQLAVAVVAGLLFGNYLDRKLGTLPWLTLIGLILGSAGGFYNLVRITNWRKRRIEKP